MVSGRVLCPVGACLAYLVHAAEMTFPQGGGEAAEPHSSRDNLPCSVSVSQHLQAEQRWHISYAASKLEYKMTFLRG
jgi:hypothetical protein